MKKEWFELKDYTKQEIDKQVWVPLRCSRKYINEGKIGYLGFKEEFLGATSILVKKEDIEKAKDLEWMDVGLMRSHKGNPYEDEYKSAFYFEEDGVIGENLIIAHEIGGEHCNNWYISPDLLSTLELTQEKDSWLAYNRGYEEVIKLHKNQNGCVDEILIRSSYLKDYLCVRDRALMVSSYKSRTEILEEEPEVDWELEKIINVESGTKWSGRMCAIHEGGPRFGEEIAILHVGRTNVNFEEDVPEFPFSHNEKGIKSESWVKKFKGKKLYRIEGEVWKNDFVYPLVKSTIILDDRDNSEEYLYVADASGTKENSKKLIDSGKYLWFKPELVEAVLAHRGANLSWYTQDTGAISFSRGDSVRFGVNKIGLITVYAKDVVLLPDWQQKIWLAYNVSPDGKVSAELLVSQQEAVPAKTLPPEEHFGIELKKINARYKELYGEKLIKYEKIDDILKNIHRFVAVRKNGLFILAKDISRLTADSFDVSVVRKALGNKPENKNLGALKLMEKILSTRVSEKLAKKIMAPLFHSYDLRIADSHYRHKIQ